MSFVLAVVAVVAAAEPAAAVWEYRGPSGEGEKTAIEIVALVREAPRAEHLVRGPGADDWRPWNQVPELAETWLATTPVRSGRGSGDPLPGAGGASPPRNAPPAPDGPPPSNEDPGPRDPAHGRPRQEGRPPPRPDGQPPGGPDGRHGSGEHGSPHDGGPDGRPHGRKSPVRVGGDVRVDFVASNLERMGGAGEPPAAGFAVSRARPIVDVTLGRWLSARTAIEVRQDDTATTYAGTTGTVDVANWAEGWSIRGREIWLAFRAGDRFTHEVRVGLQEPAFGVRDTYEERYPFAGAARADFARTTGLIAEEDLGLGWHGALEKRWRFDLQVLDGSGGTSFDPNSGKDFVGRAGLDGKLVSVSLSGLVGARGQDGAGTQAQGALAVDVHGPNQRVLVEGLLGATTEDRLDTFYSGLAASGAWDFPLKGDALDRATVVGRAQYYDPVAGWDAPDGWWAYAAGGWLGWKVLPGQVVRTGATWQMHVPQDALLPIEHDVVAEVAWRF